MAYDPLMNIPEDEIDQVVDDLGHDALAEQLGYQPHHRGLAEEVEQEYDRGREDGDPQEIDFDR